MKLKNIVGNDPALFVFLLVPLMLFVLSACGSSGGGEDGDIEMDEEKLPSCSAGEYWDGEKCVPFGNEDGDKEIDDTEDADSSDGDKADGDDIEGDGDEIEGDGDKDIDEDLDKDIIDVWDSVEREEADQTCVCDPEDPASCGQGYHCADDCMSCVPNDPDGDEEIEYDGELQEGQTLCDNGTPSCAATETLEAGHEWCPPDMACDIDSGCCTKEEIQCDNSIGCPAHWHCLSEFNVCDYECLDDFDCQRKYKRADFVCSDDGWCVISDGDEEEEIPYCNSCQDCKDIFPGEAYYCSSVTGECEEQPEINGCCDSSDCNELWSCSPADGTCYYNPPVNSGRISGTVFASSEFASFNFIVKAYDELDHLERESEPLQLTEIEPGLWGASYNLFQLAEGEKTLKIAATHMPSMFMEYHDNPVVINFLAPESTIIDSINFYTGIPNPELGSISGNVVTGPGYETDDMQVELLTQGAGGWEVLDTYYTDNSTRAQRPFEFYNLEGGNYYLRVQIAHDDDIELDYKPSAFVVEVGNESLLAYEDIELYAGISDSSLGSVSGRVNYPEYFSNPFIEKNVKIYSDFQFKYDTGKAVITSTDANGFDYEISNIESKVYWIRMEMLHWLSDEVIYTFPPPGQKTINVELRTKDFDIDIYHDTPQPDVGSISGQIYHNNVIPGRFNVQLYYDSGVSNPVLDSVEVVYNDQGTQGGPYMYFLDQLDSGTYYLKAWQVDETGTVLEELTYGGSVSPTSVTVLVESANPEEKDVSDIDFDFQTEL